MTTSKDERIAGEALAKPMPKPIYGCAVEDCAAEVSYPPDMLWWHEGTAGWEMHGLKVEPVEPGWYCENCLAEISAVGGSWTDLAGVRLDKALGQPNEAMSHEQFAEVEAKETRQAMPLDSRLTNVRINPGIGYSAEYRGLIFLVSEAREADGRWWRHASVSKRGNRNSVPSYSDLKLLKELTIGKHRKAIQVFPPEDEYYNLSDKTGVEVLHLWSCEEDVLPDFRTGGAI